MRSGKTLTRTATLWGIAALGAVAIAACGDDETSSKDTRDVPLFESDGTFPDVTTPDVSDTGTRPDVPDARDSSPRPEPRPG